MAARAAAFVRSVLFTLPAAVAVNELLFSVLRVEGRSMQPALNPGPPGGPAQSAPGTPQPDSEWVLVDKASVKLLRRYERGGVYVFWRVWGGFPARGRGSSGMERGRPPPWVTPATFVSFSTCQRPPPHTAAAAGAGRRTTRTSS